MSSSRRIVYQALVADLFLAPIAPQRIILISIVLIGIAVISGGCDLTAARTAMADASDMDGEVARPQIGLRREEEWCISQLPIQIDFSQPMQTASVRAAFSINPPIEHRLRWDSDFTRLTIQPSEQWSSLTTYLLRINDSARSMMDRVPTRPFEAVCRSEQAADAPQIIAIDSVDGGLSPSEQSAAGGTSLLGSRMDEHSDGHVGERISEHSGVDDVIRITFSRAMEHATVERALAITPAISTMLIWPTDRIVLIRPDSEFRVGLSYHITISTDGQDKSGTPLADALLLKFRLSVDHLRLLRIHLQGERQIERFSTEAALEIAPRNPLVNDYTFVLDFNQPFATDQAKNAALQHISLRGITRTGLPLPALRSFSWVGDNSLSMTYYSLAPSDNGIANYLMLTLRGGPSGLGDSLGGTLEQDIGQLFVVAERAP